jgi:hypothetical protein
MKIDVCVDEEGRCNVQVDEKTARMEVARAGWMEYMVCLGEED